MFLSTTSIAIVCLYRDVSWSYYRSEVDQLKSKRGLLLREIKRDYAKQEAQRREWEWEASAELKRQETVRQKWLREADAEHTRQAEERQKWQVEEREERERQERAREDWQEETHDWDEERRRRDEERRGNEEERRDEERRAAMGLRWDEPKPAFHCAGWDAREYTARLWNVADGYDWGRACRMTPVGIKGNVIFEPIWCEVRVSEQERL
jgi:hypothetical protein